MISKLKRTKFYHKKLGLANMIAISYDALKNDVALWLDVGPIFKINHCCYLLCVKIPFCRFIAWESTFDGTTSTN